MATQSKDFLGQFSGEASEKAQKIKEQITERAEDLKESAARAGRSAAEKINEQREPAARALEGAAAKLRERPLPGSQKVASIAQSTANKMQATADYMRNNDLNDIIADFTNFIRRYPAQTLAAAVVAGVFVGLAFRKD